MTGRGAMRRCVARAGVASLACAALLAAAGAARGESPPPRDQAGEPPAASADAAAAAVPVAPRELLDAVPRRLDLFPGTERAIDPQRVAVATEAARRAGAGAWVVELFAPVLEQDACRALFPALGEDAAAALARAAGAVFPGARPIAAGPEAARLLVPEAMPPVSTGDLEFFRAAGLFPTEVALTGEWARQAAARHAGPVPRDVLLRSARAARLEGVARLAGLVVTAGGTNVDPTELGIGLLVLDQDHAGWPREPLAEAAAAALDDAVGRALVRTFTEDGVRWALMHYLRGGPEALAEALERPGVGPEGLLRPGSRRTPPPGRPPGCRLGPRAAAALVAGDDDPPWVADLVSDSFVARDGGAVLGWLGFESSAAAARAIPDLEARGIQAEAAGAVVVVSLALR